MIQLRTVAGGAGGTPPMVRPAAERLRTAPAGLIGQWPGLRLLLRLLLIAMTVSPGGVIASAQSPEDAIVDPATLRTVIDDVPPPAAGDTPSGIDLLSLFYRGGIFMIPIAIMSVVVVMLAVERMLSLRSGKVVPRSLIRDLRTHMQSPDRFDPVAVLDTCKRHPSAASRVIGAMLMRTGQPLADIERAGNEMAQREADKYAAPIRWLNLAASATPLMGLLGTVWGMIVAFHESTTLSADRSRSEQLSEGIYTALVTTLAGLIVAIPAAMLAQHLENRLARLFHRIEQLAFDVAPGLGRLAGRSRMEADGTLRAIDPETSRGHVASASASGSRGGVTPPPVADAAKHRDGVRVT